MRILFAAVLTLIVVPLVEVPPPQTLGLGAAIVASPSYFRMMLRYKLVNERTWPSVRQIVMGAARVDPELVADLQAALPECTVHVRYGVSESVGTTMPILRSG